MYDIVRDCSHQIWENNVIFECTCDPNQIQRILINRNLLCKRTCIVATQEATPVVVNANAKVAHSNLQLGLADDVGDCCRYPGVYLSGIEDGWIGLVI